MRKDIVTDKPTVQKIMSVASPLFAEKGFAGVSVKEIAEAAHVNIALISYHFGGKENLYAAILKGQFTLVDEIISLVDREESCPIEKIRRFAKEFVKLHKKYPFIHHLIYGETRNTTQCYELIVKPGIIRSHNFLAQCIQRGINNGQIRSDIKPDCANLQLESVLHFYFLNSHLSDLFLDEKEDKAEYYMGEAIEMYLRGIFNDAKGIEKK